MIDEKQLQHNEISEEDLDNIGGGGGFHVDFLRRNVAGAKPNNAQLVEPERKAS